MTARSGRLGAIALLAMALACGISRKSVAEAGEHNSIQPRQATARGQQPAVTPSVPEHQAGPGMRYYGGPKSPMWRAPAVN